NPYSLKTKPYLIIFLGAYLPYRLCFSLCEIRITGIIYLCIYLVPRFTDANTWLHKYAPLRVPEPYPYSRGYVKSVGEATVNLEKDNTFFSKLDQESKPVIRDDTEEISAELLRKLVDDA
ncbi:hypothetical protein D0Y65_040250, partial [Glycine soja]